MEWGKIIAGVILISLSLFFNHLISYFVNRKTKHFDTEPFAKDYLYNPKIKLYKMIIAIISVTCASLITIFVIETFLLQLKGGNIYDEDGNIIRQFFGEDAIKYLYLPAFEEETILENEFFNSAYVIPNSKYECEVIETSYEKRKITPLIKKKMNLDKINALALIIDAGLEFKEPIYNILKTAAGVVLDAYSIDEIECNAEDMVQT